MNTQLLRSFVVTAELGNMTAAARRLHVSQPTLSRQIKTLEEELGIRLFERIGKFIRLSNPGESMLPRCREILEMTQSLTGSVQDLRKGKIGMLKVGASPQLLERLFPLVLPAFRAENTGVEIHLTEANTVSLLDMLSAGDLHIGVGAFAADDRYKMRRMGNLKVLAAARPQRGGRKRTNIDIAEVCEHKILSLKPGFKSRDLFDAACRLKGLRPVIALESTAPHTLIALAGAGMGYAIIPSKTPIVSDSVQTLQLTIDDKPIEFDFAAAWDPGRPMPAFAHNFIRTAQRFVDRI